MTRQAANWQPHPGRDGIVEFRVGDGVYLFDAGAENKFRVAGWYYGYPACCVEDFIERSADFDRRFGAWLDRVPFDAPYDGTPDDPRPAHAERKMHPVSGHLMCPACARGPAAPLPDRPARRFGWAYPPHGDVPPQLEGPHDYHRDDPGRGSPPVEQLRLFPAGGERR